MTSEPLATPKRHLKFDGIEAGRAIAAIAVVFYHAGNNIAEPRFFDAQVFNGHLANFNVGIDFFFVLSGFIIAWVHWRDIGQQGRLKTYAQRRFLRIYPPYWGIMLPLAALYLLSPGAGKASQHQLSNLFFSVTLLPYTAQPILGAAWTLVYEVMFYAIFGLVIWMGRVGTWLLPLWAIAILLAQTMAPLPFPASFPLSILNLEFLLGIATAIVLRRISVPAPGLIATLGVLSFFGLMLFATGIQAYPVLTRMTFGPAAAAIILGLVELERAGRLQVPRALQFLGAASYSIYLIHGFVLSMTIQVLLRLGGKVIPLPLVLLVMALCGIAAGCLYHLFVERPLIRFLRRFVDGTSRSTGPRRDVSLPPPLAVQRPNHPLSGPGTGKVEDIR